MGEFKKWSRVDIQFPGPSMDGSSKDRIPHRKEVLVIFKKPGGSRAQVVPGFFAGDGAGGSRGNVWQVRFSADTVGQWTFTTFSDEPLLDGFRGRFSVLALDGSERGFYRSGRLRRVPGRHYLKFDDGPFWIQGGSGDPVNFLGAPFGDRTLAFKKSLIDYLAAKGINAQQMAINTIDGIHDDTWPWTGSTAEEAKANHELFDLERLEEWEKLLTHMQETGVVVQLVLGSRDAWTRFDHYLCYRELVARFGHHPALIWDLGEGISNSRTSPLASVWAGILRQIDPYDHPIVARVSQSMVVNHLQVLEVLGGIGIQVRQDPTLSDLNRLTLDARKVLEAAGRTVPIIWNHTVMDRSEFDRKRIRSTVLWPVLMGGGNLILRFCHDRFRFEDLEALWMDLSRARGLIQEALFAQMTPANSLVSTGQCLANPGEAYLVYLPDGAGTVTLLVGQGSYGATWIEPATGVHHLIGKVHGPGPITLSRPTAAAGGDGVIAVRRATKKAGGYPVKASSS